MHFGSRDNYLCVEKAGYVGTTVRWRVEAVVGCDGWHSAAVHDNVKVADFGKASRGMADFAARKTQRFKVFLVEGGWLLVNRNRSGGVVIRYRVGHVKAGAAIEGVVFLSRKDAKRFCLHLGGLI